MHTLFKSLKICTTCLFDLPFPCLLCSLKNKSFFNVYVCYNLGSTRPSDLTRSGFVLKFESISFFGIKRVAKKLEILKNMQFKKKIN